MDVKGILAEVERAYLSVSAFIGEFGPSKTGKTLCGFESTSLMAVARALPHTHRAAHQKCGAHLWGFCASGDGSSGSARQCAVHSRGLQSYRRVRAGSGSAPRVAHGLRARDEMGRAWSGCCGLRSLLRSAFRSVTMQAQRRREEELARMT